MKYIEFIGLPGAGKSSFYYKEIKRLNGYERNEALSLKNKGILFYIKCIPVFSILILFFLPTKVFTSKNKFKAILRYLIFIKLLSLLIISSKPIAVDQGVVQAYWSYIIELNSHPKHQTKTLGSILNKFFDTELVYINTSLKLNIHKFIERKNSTLKTTQFDDLPPNELRKKFSNGNRLFFEILDSMSHLEKLTITKVFHRYE